jgi:hypothetical protein
VVERNLAKVDVVGSNPITRFLILKLFLKSSRGSFLVSSPAALREFQLKLP